MLDKDYDKNNEGLIDKIKKIQDKFPNLILPSMGLLDNEKRVKVDAKNYMKNRNTSREE